MLEKADPWVVQVKGSALQEKLRKKFRNLNIRFVSSWSIQEEEESDYDVAPADADGYLWIRGDLETAKRAALLAEREASKIWEYDKILIVPRPSREVWCANNVKVTASSNRGEALRNLYALYSREDKKGVCFQCWYVFGQEHEHDWGNVTPEW